MKNLIASFCGILLLLLAACSGSDTYRGAWKAMDIQGARYEIVFDARKFTVKGSDDKVVVFRYTQNSVHIRNAVKTYGIRLSDGRSYQIDFPDSKDESTGLIKDANGVPVYTISRNNYIPYTDLYQLK